MIINSLYRIYSLLPNEALSRASVPSENSGSHTHEDIAIYPPTVFNLSKRKTDLLLELAKRFIVAIEHFKETGKESLLTAIRDEKRKTLKFSYSLIASSTPPDYIRQAFASAGLMNTSSPQDICESEMIIAGTVLSLKNTHPIIIMQSMTAFLGFSVFDEVEAWLLENSSQNQEAEEELIIPGDMPEILLSKTKTPGEIEQAVHLAGPQLVAAAFAGCPQEVIEFLKTIAFSQLGSILLDSEIKDARNRLSSEELADAQNAFLELLGSMHDAMPPAIETEEKKWASNIDKELVSDISNLILELDEKVLKTVVSNLDPKIIASLIQAMEPVAHDRLFSSIAASREKKILDALETSVPQNSIDLTREAQLFAQKILSTVSPHNKSLGKPLALPTKVRQLLTSILSRE